MCSDYCRLLETENINVNHTAPGALIALALIYIKSNKVEIAQRVAVPHTTFDLDNIRPDILIFRSLAYNMIMWSQVTPSMTWLRSGIPAVSLS
jgi:anaphase-promoting complex subunit 1